MLQYLQKFYQGFIATLGIYAVNNLISDLITAIQKSLNDIWSCIQDPIKCVQKTWDDLKELLDLLKQLFGDPSKILKILFYAFSDTIDAFIDPNVNAYERMYNVGSAMAQIIIPIIPDVVIAIGTGGAIKAGKVIVAKAINIINGTVKTGVKLASLVGRKIKLLDGYGGFVEIPVMSMGINANQLAEVVAKLSNQVFEKLKLKLANAHEIKCLESIKNSRLLLPGLSNTNKLDLDGPGHVLNGLINPKGKPVGFHHISGATNNTKILSYLKLDGTPSPDKITNSWGAYYAKVAVQGVEKTSNAGKSSMFPDHWSRQTVMDKINEAYDTAQHVSGTKNTWLGHTKAGEPIEFFNSIDGPQLKPDKIISAWPKI